MRRQKQRGITLIALVITIIVLLILAGVSISLTLGENGILNQAKNGVENHRTSSEEEMILLGFNAYQTAKLTGQSVSNPDVEGATVTENGEDGWKILFDKTGNQYTLTSNGSITGPFNAAEWDKTAADEDCFIWESNVKGSRGYGKVIGYTEKLNNYTKLRYPSRCTKITCANNLNYNGIDGNTSRSFTNNIVSVEVPGTVTDVEYAFSSAGSVPTFSKLKEITFEEGLVNIGTWTFYYTTSLESVKLPSTLKSIGGSAFYECRNLVNIEFPNGLKEIGTNAFRGTGITTLNIPNSVIKIGERTFHDTPWYSSQPSGIIYINNILYTCKGSVSNLNIKDGTIYISPWALGDVRALTSVTVPSSVVGIGEWAFARCTNLTSITGLHENITDVGECAFRDTPWLNSQPSGLLYIGKVLYKYKDASTSNTNPIEIKNGTVQIVNQALCGCKSEEVIIPDTVKEMGFRVFGACSNLKRVKLPNQITDIKSQMFDGCTSLTSVTIPDNVKSIALNTFENCTSLKEVTLSKKVEKIEWGVFKNCTSLTDIYFKGTESEWQEIKIDSSNQSILNNVTIHYNQ